MAKQNGLLKESLDHIQYLEKQDERRTEFFLAASHQLKSPVAIIQWCLQTVMEDQTIDPKVREMVLKSLMQANAMSQLITDMLHIFRLGSKKGKKDTYTSVDVNKLIGEIAAQYEVVAHKQGVHLIKGPLETVPAVFADEPYLKQAILNLVDNAIKYSRKDGHVTVTSSLAKDGFIEVKVADQGIGIAQAEISKLFTEFFRGQEAQEVAHDGTGLGLVLVKHVIEEFGGQVLLDSELHKGSVFTIRLPRMG